MLDQLCFRPFDNTRGNGDFHGATVGAYKPEVIALLWQFLFFYSYPALGSQRLAPNATHLTLV